MIERAERHRLSTNRERVEACMRDFKWHSSVELIAIGGMRAVGRLHELKAKGFDYQKRKKTNGVWEYLLTVPKEVQLPLVEVIGC